MNLDEVLRDAKAGKSEAVALVVENHAKLVWRIVHGIRGVPRSLDKFDLFQVGVIGLLHALRGFDVDRRDCKFSTYAFPAIRNAIICEVESERRRNVLLTCEPLEPDASIPFREEERPDNAPSINQILGELSPDSQQLIRARFEEGLTFDQIAKTEGGVSRQRIHQRITKICRRIRKQVETELLAG